MKNFGSDSFGAGRVGGGLGASPDGVAGEGTVAEAAQVGVGEGLKRSLGLPAVESGGNSSADAETALGALSIADSGWSVDSGGYVNYAFFLKNEKNGLRVMFPTVKITGRDASGKVLFSQDQVLYAINPGETLCFGSFAGNGTAPESVEFTVVKPADYDVSKHAAESPKFEVHDVSAMSDGFGGVNFTGEVTCLGGASDAGFMGEVAVTVVLRDDVGKIVYGTTAHVDCPAEGKATTFEACGGLLPKYASIEAYAQVW